MLNIGVVTHSVLTLTSVRRYSSWKCACRKFHPESAGSDFEGGGIIVREKYLYFEVNLYIADNIINIRFSLCSEKEDEISVKGRFVTRARAQY